MELPKSTHSAEMQKVLVRSVLTSGQMHDLCDWYGSDRPDKHRWYVDWRLLDAFKEIWETENWKENIEQLRLSAKDKNLTKCFYNQVPTVSNWLHFIDKSVDRPDFRRNENFRVAHNLLRKSLKIKKLEPINLTLENLDLIWSNKEASVGATNPRHTKDESRHECLSEAELIRSKIQSGIDFSEIWVPYVAFHRAQLGNLVSEDGKYTYEPKEKDRLVLGEAGGSVTLEGCYASPLIKHMTNNWYSYSGGDDPNQTRRKIRESGESKYWTSLDFSKFDQTVQAWLIEDVFSIIKEFFDPKYHKELDWICYQFINSWLVMPGGRIEQKHRGIPSGSNFTQVVGSMCNAMVILTYLASRKQGASTEEKMRYVEMELGFTRKSKVRECDLTMFVMGDDNLLFHRSKIDLVNLNKYVHRVFGMEVHPEKVDDYFKSGKYPKYLKRVWKDRGEYRNPLELAINVCHPERERTYDNYSEWHIMYGLYLTYRLSFPRGLNEKFLLRKMEEHGGVKRLLDLKGPNLPGVFRTFGDEYRWGLYHRAKNLLGNKVA